MRLSTLSILALPLLAAAAQQESPLDQAKAQAQYWLEKFQSYIPNPNRAHTPQAAAAKAGGKTLNILTLNDWEHTIRSSVKPTSTKPEQWWILLTGGNKTCFGHCGPMEKAYNETALLWSVNPTAPHLAYLDCDAQPVLCNSWGAGPPSLWVMEVLPKPAPVTIWTKHLNTTTTTVKTFTDLHTSKEWATKTPYDGWFHPFDGQLAKAGVAVPLGYFFWVFNILPSWLFMVLISFVSRSFMGRKMNNPRTAPAGAAAPAPAAR